MNAPAPADRSAHSPALLAFVRRYHRLPHRGEALAPWR